MCACNSSAREDTVSQLRLLSKSPTIQRPCPKKSGGLLLYPPHAHTCACVPQPLPPQTEIRKGNPKLYSQPLCDVEPKSYRERESKSIACLPVFSFLMLMATIINGSQNCDLILVNPVLQRVDGRQDEFPALLGGAQREFLLLSRKYYRNKCHLLRSLFWFSVEDLCHKTSLDHCRNCSPSHYCLLTQECDKTIVSRDRQRMRTLSQKFGGQSLKNWFRAKTLSLTDFSVDLSLSQELGAQRNQSLGCRMLNDVHQCSWERKMFVNSGTEVSVRLLGKGWKCLRVPECVHMCDWLKILVIEEMTSLLWFIGMSNRLGTSLPYQAVYLGW